jgi:2-dehydropantoate 2-reductase
MKIVIVGGGAIGRLFAALLGRGGHEVILAEPQKEVVDAINQRGVGIMDVGVEDPDAVSFVSAKAVRDPTEISHCDCVLLAVKSFDTLAAVKSVAHLIRQDSPLLSIQTGLGNVEMIEKVVPKQAIIGGFTFMSAASLGAERVRHGGIGKTYLGELDGTISSRLTDIHHAFTESGIETSMVKQIIGRLWCKVIVYSAINPVSAILKVKNGSLVSRMESITLMKRLIDEGKAVAEAYAIDLVYPDLYELLFDACKQSANNLSSMLQDILNAKRTEIDAQNGALCHYGEQKNIALPTHQTLVQLIKLMERWGVSGGHI